MSQIVASSFLYPWPRSARRVVEPPGLTQNVGEDWSRIELASGLAVDVAPDTRIMTDQGWLLPEDLVERGAFILVATSAQAFTFNDVAFNLAGSKSYKVLAVYSINEGEARLDQLGDDPELGGDENSTSEGAATQNPIPEETCECVFLNQPCGVPHENINDLMSVPL